MPIEFIVSVGAVNGIGATHPAVLAVAKQVGFEQVRDEAGEAAVRAVDSRQAAHRRRAASDAAPTRLGSASPEGVRYLADQQALQHAIDLQTGGGPGRSR